jgi:ATP-dependent protease ClpP protease subunit
MPNEENKISSEKVKVNTKYHTLRDYKVYITGSFEEMSDYIDLIDFLRETTEGDRVKIFINSPGGKTDIAFQIINAMRDCKSKITTVMDGICGSCATWVFLSGDEYLVNDYSQMLIHWYTWVAGGKGHEIKSRSDHYEDMFEKVAKEIYKDFLNEDEIKNIKGSDYWFNSNEVKNRLKKMIKLRNKKSKKSNKKVNY